MEKTSQEKRSRAWTVFFEYFIILISWTAATTATGQTMTIIPSYKEYKTGFSFKKKKRCQPNKARKQTVVFCDRFVNSFFSNFSFISSNKQPKREKSMSIEPSWPNRMHYGIFLHNKQRRERKVVNWKMARRQLGRRWRRLVFLPRTHPYSRQTTVRAGNHLNVFSRANRQRVEWIAVTMPKRIRMKRTTSEAALSMMQKEKDYLVVTRRQWSQSPMKRNLSPSRCVSFLFFFSISTRFL